MGGEKNTTHKANSFQSFSAGQEKNSVVGLLYHYAQGAISDHVVEGNVG